MSKARDFCACGREKDRRAVVCFLCRQWSQEEDDVLEAMIAAGDEYTQIARKLGRSKHACRSRAFLRNLKKDHSSTLANRERGRKRFWNDKVKVARWRRAIAKSFTPLDRAIRAEELRQRNRAGIMGVRHHTEEVRARISAANKGRKLTPEHRAKIGAGRSAYFKRLRENEPEQIYRRAMLSSLPHIRTADAGQEDAAKQWCAQCDRLVSDKAASVCSSRFCSLRSEAA